jgi:predicted component of type VI protein secretion system
MAEIEASVATGFETRVRAAEVPVLALEEPGSGARMTIERDGTIRWTPANSLRAVSGRFNNELPE